MVVIGVGERQQRRAPNLCPTDAINHPLTNRPIPQKSTHLQRLIPHRRTRAAAVAGSAPPPAPGAAAPPAAAGSRRSPGPPRTRGIARPSPSGTQQSRRGRRGIPHRLVVGGGGWRLGGLAMMRERTRALLAGMDWRMQGLQPQSRIPNPQQIQPRAHATPGSRIRPITSFATASAQGLQLSVYTETRAHSSRTREDRGASRRRRHPRPAARRGRRVGGAGGGGRGWWRHRWSGWTDRCWSDGGLWCCWWWWWWWWWWLQWWGRRGYNSPGAVRAGCPAGAGTAARPLLPAADGWLPWSGCNRSGFHRCCWSRHRCCADGGGERCYVPCSEKGWRAGAAASANGRSAACSFLGGRQPVVVSGLAAACTPSLGALGLGGAVPCSSTALTGA